ncbi:MAG: hypothetical protein O2807_04710 [bacterium]|nr:hypothetical protein [bacterium]
MPRTEDDVLTPPCFAEALHGIIKGSALHRLDAGGHNSGRRGVLGESRDAA